MIDPDLAIEVENIGKCYRIGVKEKMHDSFISTALDALKRPITNFRKYRSLYRFNFSEADMAAPPNGEDADIIWALKGVSFQVRRGEIIGIIGRNGAGKSTLLKILSRITDPTFGYAAIRGRISCLLEVGTGFHQELTGRENVYLNGTILGMTKREVDRKLEEIVEFSGVRKFIDTPIKRYSSGMKLRLAFSVAAHLEPEILIVDEVLAVGDAAFQKKCISKMEEVGRHGRTVLFVSHNMQAVARLCSRTLLLENGTIVKDGPSSQVISEYLLADSGTMAAREWHDPAEAPQGNVAVLRAVRARDADGHVTEAFDIRHPILIEMAYDVRQPGHVLLPHFQVYNDEGIHVFGANDLDPDWRNKPRPAGRYVSTAVIPGNLLAEGPLYITVALVSLFPKSFQFKVPDAIAFNVFDSMDGDSARGDWHKRMGGAVRPKLEWFTVFSEAAEPQGPAGPRSGDPSPGRQAAGYTYDTISPQKP